MRSLNRVGACSVSLPLPADDIVEFHAARILLLLSVCGMSGHIDGLTKMAKLDFFARYPDFFEAARAAIESGQAQKAAGRSVIDDAPKSIRVANSAIEPAHIEDSAGRWEHDEVVESAMVRYHYGPWDKRYYHVLAHLEAKRLIAVTKERTFYRLALTELGRDRAKLLATRATFAPLVERLRDVKKSFGSKSGSFLKSLIYRLFDAEVGRRAMGEVIR